MLHQFGNNSASSFSIFFPMSGSKQAMDQEGGYSGSYMTNPSSSSSVDCTLSLGPPSSSSSSSAAAAAAAAAAPQRYCAAPSFCWDIISQSKASSHPPTASRVPTQNINAASNMGGDPLLLARRCANCDTVSTPLWRNGPRGPKSLCNACGIRYKKEERRAAASTSTPSSAAAAAAGGNNNEAISYSNYQRQQQQQQQINSSWGCYNANYSTAAAAAAANSGRDDDMDQVPYLSWRLNVVPQATLFQYQ